MSPSEIAKPPNSVARACAFSTVRLAMMMRPMPCSCRWRAVSSMVSPAPMSRAVCLEKSLKICLARLTARHLQEQGIGRIIIANRTVEKAHALATDFGCFAISLGDMPNHLAEADLVISSTASQLPILGKGAIERAIKQRKHRPILMIDIAVPRDIEPEAGELEDVYLYTVDDLHEIIQEGLRSRQEAAKQSEEIIENQVAHFMGWLRSLDAGATIRAFRDTAEELRDQEIAKAKRLLARGVNAEEVLTQLARTLTNKLIHAPSAHMRQAGFEGRAEVLEIARELFDLKDPHS